MEWVCRLDGGPKRVNHAAVAVGDTIYSFGGFCSGTNFTRMEGIDVHAFNTSNWRWEKIETTPKWSDDDEKPGYRPRMPFKRYGHSVVVYQGKVYLWGGRNDHSVCNTLFCFDPRRREWSVPEVKTLVSTPPACDGHSACVIGSKMYIFGGFEDGAQQFSQELYAYDFEECNWSYIRPSTPSVPPQRDFHSAVAIGDDMYIFGGRSDESAPHYTGRDVYPWRMFKFNTITRTWSQVGRNVYPPLPKGRRSLSAFEYNGNMYVTCGYNGIEKKHYNDFYKFDVRANQWYEVKPRGLGPMPRRRMSCCVLGDRVFFFGGTSPRMRIENGVEATDDDEIVEGELRGLENHGDIFILDMNPSLRTSCMLAVLRSKLDYAVLPWDVKIEMQRMDSGKAPEEPKSRDFKRCMMA